LIVDHDARRRGTVSVTAHEEGEPDKLIQERRTDDGEHDEASLSATTPGSGGDPFLTVTMNWRPPPGP
jgi:hypothetical protein